MSNTVEDTVVATGLCAGCGLCVAVAGRNHARMRYNGDGFLRPAFERPLTREENAVVSRACPGARLDLDADEAEMNPDWGPLKSQWLAHAAHETMRFKASSGGALSAVVDFMLENKLADYVLQNAADADHPILNKVTESTDREAVIASAGSRYTPSSPLRDVLERLEDGRRFVFVGKPCDVAALRMYARQDERVDRSVVLMVSFMCAGVPSVEGTRQVLKELGVAEAELERFRFRGNGWPGLLTATRRDGTEASMSYDESWGRILTHYRQPRCKICPDGTGFFADLTFGDGWELNADGKPDFEEKPGQSLVLVRSTRGERVFQQCRSSGHLMACPVDIGNLEKIQPYQAKRTRLTLSRQLALALLGRPRPRYRGMRLTAAACKAGIRNNFVSFAGTLARVWRGRI